MMKAMNLNNPSGIISYLISLFESDENLGGITFVPEFPEKTKPSPLRSVTASLGVKSSEILPVDLGNPGIKKYSVSISVDIFSPYSLGSEICSEAFFKITQSLSKSSEINAVSSKSVQLKANRSTDSLLLGCEIAFEFLAYEVR